MPVSSVDRPRKSVRRGSTCAKTLRCTGCDPIRSPIYGRAVRSLAAATAG